MSLYSSSSSSSSSSTASQIPIRAVGKLISYPCLQNFQLQIVSSCLHGCISVYAVSRKWFLGIQSMDMRCRACVECFNMLQSAPQTSWEWREDRVHKSARAGLLQWWCPQWRLAMQLWYFWISTAVCNFATFFFRKDHFIDVHIC